MSKLSNFVVQLKPYICEKICEYVRYYFGTQDGWEKRSCETTHQFNRNFITFLGMPMTFDYHWGKNQDNYRKNNVAGQVPLLAQAPLHCWGTYFDSDVCILLDNV